LTTPAKFVCRGKPYSKVGLSSKRKSAIAVDAAAVIAAVIAIAAGAADSIAAAIVIAVVIAADAGAMMIAAGAAVIAGDGKILDLTGLQNLSGLLQQRRVCAST
jgi:hypothetical protein